MSTTFAVHTKGTIIPMQDDEPIFDEIEMDDMVHVALRSGRGIRWTNHLSPLLPDETPVYPLDNTAQGIYTIGDIKREQ
jgi:hypothetical protein